MNSSLDIKRAIHQRLLAQLDQKLQVARHEIESSKAARNNETKSTAGDKHETGRAMMQMELDRNEGQLQKLAALRQELLQLNIEKEYSNVQPGSLVITNQGSYFISVGLGKIHNEDAEYYAISLASPLGQLLNNKKVGSTFHFLDKGFRIITIY